MVKHIYTEIIVVWHNTVLQCGKKMGVATPLPPPPPPPHPPTQSLEQPLLWFHARIKTPVTLRQGRN